MHLVGFTIEIYHDARTYVRHIWGYISVDFFRHTRRSLGSEGTQSYRNLRIDEAVVTFSPLLHYQLRVFVDVVQEFQAGLQSLAIRNTG